MAMASLGLSSAGVGCLAGFFVGRRQVKQQIKPVDQIEDKMELVAFLKKACKNKNTPEFKELYKFLLGVFKKADRDFDGIVGAEDFDLMVEMAGTIPRMFAFAPTSMESFATDQERIAYRKDAFAKIDADKSGGIGFDEWLNYCYDHICKMTATIDEGKVDLGRDSKEGFKQFCVNASRDRRTPEYKELFNVLLGCFVEADTDMDGRVNVKEFDGLIDIAAELPRKFGYAPPSSQTYKNDSEKLEARAKMFKAMDTDGNGTITFEEWLDFAYKHICQKTAQLDNRLTGVPPVFKAGGAGRCPYGFA